MHYYKNYKFVSHFEVTKFYHYFLFYYTPKAYDVISSSHINVYKIKK